MGLSERKMDPASVGNHTKVKVMATQLLAKFEENAPAQPAGLKRQVRRGSHESLCGVTVHGKDDGCAQMLYEFK